MVLEREILTEVLSHLKKITHETKVDLFSFPPFPQNDA